MDKFIGVKLVDAEFMTRGDYNFFRGLATPDDENPENPGYLVKYASGYVSWCPADEFRKQNLPITGAGNKVSEYDVNFMIKHVDIQTIEPNTQGNKVTVVTVTLRNGFTITESSACVDPANYSEKIGAECCMEKIKDKIWFLLGFLLQSGVYGFNGGTK